MGHDYCKDMVNDPSLKNKLKCTYQAVTGESASVKASNQRMAQRKAIDDKLKEERARMAQSADSMRVAEMKKGLDSGFLRIGSKLDVKDYQD